MSFSALTYAPNPQSKPLLITNHITHHTYHITQWYGIIGNSIGGTFLSRLYGCCTHETDMAILSRSGGDIGFILICPHCVLLSALTYALSPTPLHHISHHTPNNKYQTPHIRYQYCSTATAGEFHQCSSRSGTYVRGLCDRDIARICD